MRMKLWIVILSYALGVMGETPRPTVSPCNNNACKNGATCYPNTLSTRGYGCNCQSGYVGSLCETVRQQLRIIPPGQTQMRSLGRSILFTCRLNSQDTTSSTRLKWLDNNRNDIQTTSGRVYVERYVNDQKMLKLYITNLIETDAGKYTCQQLEVNTSNHVENVVQEVHVNLAIFKDITFDGCGSPQYLAIHRKATIQCRVSGSPTPTVYWRFNGQRISSQTHPRYTQVNAGLEIRNVTNDDEGVFTCSAEVKQNGMFDNREINVQVHSPPRL